MNLNPRQKAILEQVLSKEDYITVADVSKKISVSTRTVLRELPTIEEWINGFSCELDKRSGKGILIKGTKENLQNIKISLHNEGKYEIYTPEFRRIFLIKEIIQNTEPIKLSYFTRKLEVTEGTLSNDLDKIESWFEKFNLKLVRKQGVGIYLKGIEENFRSAIISFIYENNNQDEILDLIINENNNFEERNDNFFSLISLDVLNPVTTLVKGFKDELSDIVSDNLKMRLIVHLALIVVRAKNDEDIFLTRSQLANLKKYQEFETAWLLARTLEKSFEIEISDGEVGYITMLLSGLKYNATIENRNLENFHLSKALAKKIIKMTEARTGIFLDDDDYLIAGLLNHLELAIKRLSMNMQIRNPLIEDIKEFYPEYFQIAKEWSVALDKELNISIPESEIGFITMHIAAFIEKSQTIKDRTFNVVVSCVTGIGTSTLLASRLGREYSNLTIVDVVPTIEISEKWLEENKIDFIISTVAINNVSVPVVTVNPILLKGDKEKINKLIEGIKLSGGKSRNKLVNRTVSVKSNALKLRSYINGMIDVLDNFFVEEIEDVTSIESAIDKAIRKVNISDDHRLKLKEDLLAREKIGSTIIRGEKAMLLHCRSKSVNHGYFGLIRIKNDDFIAFDGDYQEAMKLVIVMIAPEDCDKSYREVLSNLCEMLVEEGIIKNFATKPKLDVLLMIDNRLEEFYNRKI